MPEHEARIAELIAKWKARLVESIAGITRRDNTIVQLTQQIVTLTAERDHLAAWLPHWKAKTEAAEARATALEAAAGALVAKLDVIIPKVDGLIAFQTVRTGHQAYDGPNLIAELADLRALLSPPPPSQETT